MNDQPKISIIIACYNCAKYIKETLVCVLEQEYENWECIIVDDGSTDQSALVVQDYIKDKKNYIYIKQSNKGASVARNTAIKHSSGKYILPLDADDLMSKSYTKLAVEILEKDPEIKLVYCKTMLFGNKKGEFKLVDYSFERLIIQNMIVNSSVYRRADYDRTSGYDPEMYDSEDWEFWISLLKTGGKVYKIPDFLFFYRKHKGSKNKKFNAKREALRQYVCRKHSDIYAYFFDNPIQIYFEHQKYKKAYNIIRRLTFRKLID
ncbi:MAG TPA: glycosyltransferase family A protein [Pelobium sp.]|nr:glycosyltransferase family A protein [Pelobium sp.]